MLSGKCESANGIVAEQHSAFQRTSTWPNKLPWTGGMAASDGVVGGAWAAEPARPTVPRLEQCGTLLGSWCLLLDGDERHGNPYNVWLPSFIELSGNGIAVHDHRNEAERRRVSFHIPFGGTLFSVCPPQSQPHLFVVKLELCACWLARRSRSAPHGIVSTRHPKPICHHTSAGALVACRLRSMDTRAGAVHRQGSANV